MANLFTRLLGLGPKIPLVSPFREQGVSGTAVYGGYIASKETQSKLYGQEKYRTASDIITNISIVAAGVRYFLNLLAKPQWKVDADDDEQSKQLVEFVEEVMESMDTSWPRIIRRAGLYRYHGFGIQEWTAIKRDDGRIGFQDIESRPQHTIEKWAVDERGTVTGVWQRSPQTGQLIGLPRQKLVYLLDDTLTDSPEGLGWFRHLVDPSERLKIYLQLEGYGFQRDLSGTPIGRAPIAQINKLVNNGTLTREQAEDMLKGLENFVKLQAKKPDTGLLLDSQPHESQTADGLQVSSVPQWGLELLTGTVTSLDPIDKAISRLTYDMARIMGIENLLTGSEGTGSLALSKDKSRNIYLQVDATLSDMAAAFSKDFIDPLWTLNGLPDERKPKLKTEAVAFKDVEQITSALRDMATAGASLQPDDPAIDEVRDLLGLSHAPEFDAELMGIMSGRLNPDGSSPDQAQMDHELEMQDKQNKATARKKPNGSARRSRE